MELFSQNEHEMMTLGGILLENDVLEQCLEMGLTSKAFSPIGATIYRECVNLFSQGKEANAVSLKDICDRDYMSRCMDEYVGKTVSVTAAEELLRRYRMRSINENAEAFLKIAQNWKGSPEELAGKAAEMFTIEDGEENHNPMDAALRLIDYWESTPEEERSGLHWFIPEMERDFSTITNEIVYLEAERSVGKTAFALAWCAANAIKGNRVSFVSLESMRDSMASRLVTVIGGENSIAMKRRTIYGGAYQKAREKINSFPKDKIGWSFTTSSTEAILAWARAEKKRGSVAIFIDNMRHITTPRGRSKTEEFGECSKAIKRIRDIVDIPVITLHHLNQEGNTAWSKDIENDADIIIKLTNGTIEDWEQEKKVMDVGQDIMPVVMSITKWRDGKCGVMPLEFIKSKQTFKYAGPNPINEDIPEEML